MLSPQLPPEEELPLNAQQKKDSKDPWRNPSLRKWIGFPALVQQARQLFPLYMTGKATTAVNLFAIGGTFLLQWWMGLIINLFPADGVGRYPPQAYTAALMFTGIGTLLALLWYLPLAAAPRPRMARPLAET